MMVDIDYLVADIHHSALSGVSKKLKDMGDGTHAEAVVAVELDAPFTVTGRVRDPAMDVTFNYDDGTSETLWYTTAGDIAGKGPRA